MRIKNIENEIKVVLNYLWRDEKKHYQELPRKQHVYLYLKKIAKEINYFPA